MTRRRLPMLIAALMLACAAPLHAQVRRADALLRAGQLAAAESAYYATSDARPRDPVARAALGRYLAARGAVRVGAVLLEEARQFGGDPAAIGRELAPMYWRLGDYHALVTMPASPLSRAERAQAVWLIAHAPNVAAPESVVIALHPATAAVSLGSIALRIGRRVLQAEVDPRGGGLTLDEAWRPSAAAVFGGKRTTARLGAMREVAIGDLVLGNVPVRFAALGDRNRAVVGIDLLERFAPAADPQAARLVLRRAGDVPAKTAGQPLPTLTDAQGIRVLINERWLPLTDPVILDRLRTTPWMLDPVRGLLVLP